MTAPTRVEATAPVEIVGRRTLRTARSVVLLGGSELLGKIATLVLFVVAARSLGPTAFGAFSFALAFGLLLAELPSWGYDTVVVQRGAADPARLPTLLGNVFLARLAASVVVLVVGGAVGAATRDSRAAATALVLMLLAALVEGFTDAYRAGAAALERQGGSALVIVVQRVATAVLAVAVLVAGGGLIGLASAYLAGTVIGLLGTRRVARSVGVRVALRGVDRSTLVELTVASTPTGINAVVSMTLFRLDAVLLGLLVGEAAVGAYAVAYRLMETVLFVAWSVSRAVFPVVASNATPARVLRGMQTGLGVIASVFLPYGVVLALRGEDILLLLYGNSYSTDSTSVLRALAFAPLVFGVAYLMVYSLIAAEKAAQVLLGSIAALVVNAVANALLIPRLEGLGAALVTTGSYVVEAAVLGVLLRRWVRGRDYLSPLVAPAVGSVAAAAVLLLPLPLLPALAAAVVAYVVVWFAVARTTAPEHAAVARRVLRR